MAASVRVFASGSAALAQKTQLLVYTALETDQLKAYQEGFNKAHPDIDIKWVRDSTGVITAKLLAEKANPQADAVMGVDNVLAVAGGSLQVRFRALTPQLGFCLSDTDRAQRLAYHLGDPCLPMMEPSTVLTAGYVLAADGTDIERCALVCHVGNEVLYAIPLNRSGHGEVRAPVQLPLTRQTVGKPEIELPGGEWLTPTQTQLMPAADAASQTVEWRLDLPPGASARLTPGQQLRVRVTGAGTLSRLVLPESAVLRRGELNAVYVAAESGFRLRAVRLGAARPGLGIEVLAGLRSGERVARDAVRAGLEGAQP